MESAQVASPSSLSWSIWSLLVTVGVGVLLFVYRSIFSFDYDPREPPLIKPSIPFVGHILGMIRYGTKYFDIVNRQTQYPIYTLPTLSSRQYIVTSPEIAAQLQRQHKDLAFYNVILEVTRRMLHLNKNTMDIVMTNVNRENGGTGLIPKMHDMFSDVLGRGEYLKDLTNAQMSIFSEELGQVAVGSESIEVGLSEWIKLIFAVANTKALYGPENPFSVEPSLIQSFWDFEANMLALIIDVLPSITARKAHQGRERVVQGLIDYVKAKRYHKASQVIQNRIGLNLGHGFSDEEAGRCELVLLFAIMGNAVPSTFWITANIFSRPELLAEIRNEVDSAVADDGDGRKIINTKTLETACPLFVSTYRETLRMIGNLASLRYVLRDTVIGQQYLKKDSIIQMVGIVIHHDKKTWGEDSDKFNPRRFIKTQESEGDKQELSEIDLKEPSATQLPSGVPSAAFRLFGGGSVVCPGRHFAQSEILAFVAYLILAFEITAPDGTSIRLPPKDDEKIPLSVLKPKGDVRMKLQRRKGFEATGWILKA